MNRTWGFPLVLLLLASAAMAQVPATLPAQGGPPSFPGAAQPGAPPRPAPAPARDRAATPAPGTSVMRGRVLAADGMPLRRAQVNLLAALDAGVPQRRGATTDADGKWEVTDLPAGRYTVSASKAGYVTVQYGQRRPFEQGTQVVVAEGATIEHLDIPLPRGAVIAGRVVDEFGEPVAQMAVQAMRYTYSNDGQRRLTAVSSAATDDLGQFRVFGLMPGEYIVQATVAGGFIIGGGGPGPAPESFAVTYYPGTPNADEAQTVTLGLAQEFNAQFQLIPTRVSRVTGVVVNSEGAPMSGMSLSLVTPMGGNGWTSSGAGSTAADGTFTLTNVTPGEHTINASSPRRIEGAEFGSYNFNASGEPLTVRIMTSKGTALGGRVVWEGTAARGTTPIRVNVQQLVQAAMPLFITGAVPGADGTVSDDNTFKLAGAAGKGFIRTLPLPTGWAIKSITVDGEDVTDVPIEFSTRRSIDDIRVVLTDKLTDLTGTVADARGTLLKDYVVILLPSGLKEGLSPQRFIRMVRPDQDGSFRVKGLPPGSYAATALDWVEQGRQFVPTFQEQLRKAGKTLTLREGQATTIDLKLTDGL
jgi:protocatechuate 3,4-dioxygenase beta subunit